jgi:hypothetical protein
MKCLKLPCSKRVCLPKARRFFSPRLFYAGNMIQGVEYMDVDMT